MRFISCTAFLVAAALPVLAQAKESGVELGTRAAYAHAFGKLEDAEDAEMSKYVRANFPVWFDIGWRINRVAFIGGYASVGAGWLGKETQDSCDAIDADCGALALRFGVQGQFHLAPKKPVDPWVGVGGGLESLGVAYSYDNRETGVGAAGWEGFLQGGLDIRLSKYVSLGPFAAFSVGRFGKAKCDGDDCDLLETEIEKQAFHEWLQLGVRVEFGPF